MSIQSWWYPAINKIGINPINLVVSLVRENLNHFQYYYFADCVDDYFHKRLIFYYRNIRLMIEKSDRRHITIIVTKMRLVGLIEGSTVTITYNDAKLNDCLEKFVEIDGLFDDTINQLKKREADNHTQQRNEMLKKTLSRILWGRL